MTDRTKEPQFIESGSTRMKIGTVTYTVKTYFRTEGETLEKKLQRMIKRDAEQLARGQE